MRAPSIALNTNPAKASQSLDNASQKPNARFGRARKSTTVRNNKCKQKKGMIEANT
jgi:hypothetical protein